jgi:hypothetical protein
MAVADTRGQDEYWEHRGQTLLIIAFVLPMAAWALNELAGYALVKPVCAAGHPLLLTALSAAMLAMVGTGAAIAWSCLRRAGDASADGGRRIDRSYFVAGATIGFNLLIGLLILTAAVPPFILSPCE